MGVQGGATSKLSNAIAVWHAAHAMVCEWPGPRSGDFKFNAQAKLESSLLPCLQLEAQSIQQRLPLCCVPAEWHTTKREGQHQILHRRSSQLSDLGRRKRRPPGHALGLGRSQPVKVQQLGFNLRGREALHMPASGNGTGAVSRARWHQHCNRSSQEALYGAAHLAVNTGEVKFVSSAMFLKTKPAASSMPDCLASRGSTSSCRGVAASA